MPRKVPDPLQFRLKVSINGMPFPGTPVALFTTTTVMMGQRLAWQ